MQFKYCLSSVAKFMYVLGGMVPADLIVWYCIVALAHHHYKILYKKREIWVSVLLTEKKKPYCCLYSRTVNYWYTVTSCMFLSQPCTEQGTEICNSSDLCWNPLCWQSMASSTNWAGSCSMILCAEHCPDTGQDTLRHLPSQQIPCCEQRTSHITATAINQSQYTSSFLLHLSD